MAVRLIKDDSEQARTGTMQPTREYTPTHLIDEEATMSRPAIEKIEPSQSPVVIDIKKQEKTLADIDNIAEVLENADLATQLKALDKLKPVMRTLKRAKSDDLWGNHGHRLAWDIGKIAFGLCCILIYFMYGKEHTLEFGQFGLFMNIIYLLGGLAVTAAGIFDVARIQFTVWNERKALKQADKQVDDNNALPESNSTQLRS